MEPNTGAPLRTHTTQNQHRHGLTRRRFFGLTLGAAALSGVAACGVPLPRGQTVTIHELTRSWAISSKELGERDPLDYAARLIFAPTTPIGGWTRVPSLERLSDGPQGEIRARVPIGFGVWAVPTLGRFQPVGARVLPGALVEIASVPDIEPDDDGSWYDEQRAFWVNREQYLSVRVSYRVEVVS